MLSPKAEGEPSSKAPKRLRKVLDLPLSLTFQSVLKSKSPPKVEANNFVEAVPEEQTETSMSLFFQYKLILPLVIHSKPFPPSGKNGRVFKKVVIADEKLEGPISFDKEEDRAVTPPRNRVILTSDS